MTNLTSLIARLQAGSGADRELDRGIWIALANDPGRIAEPLTASIDACVALIERVLPGWGWILDKSPEGSFVATLLSKERKDFGGMAASLPRAILVALLTAIGAKEAQDND